MPLVVPYTAGEFLMLQYILGMASLKEGFTASTVTGPVLHLYSNEVTGGVTAGTLLSDLVECTSSGYNAITLTSNAWTTVQAGGITTGVYSQQTFSFNTNAVSYGYYVTEPGAPNGAGRLLWLERFTGAPFSIPTGGGTIAITSKITLA